MANYEAVKRCVEKRYVNGLCKRCGKKPYAEGKTLCEDCLAYQRIRMNSLHAERKYEGRCTRCGGPINGHVVCEKCLQKDKEKRNARKESGQNN